MDEISKQQSFGDLELGVLTLGVALLCVLAVYSYGFATADIFYPNIPVFGGERSISEMKKEFKTKSRALVDAAYKKNTGICQIVTDGGPRVLLPPRFVNEIRNDKRFDFQEVMKEEFSADLFGASQAALQDGLLQDTIRTKLTQSLAKLTVALSEETSDALSGILPPSQDWRDSGIFLADMTELVSRMSARAFIGEPLCRNKEWLKIAAAYTMEFFVAIQAVRRFPKRLRPLLLNLAPEVQRLNQIHKTARALLAPELESRTKARKEAQKAGIMERSSDALAWFTEVASAKKLKFDPLYGQLGLTVVATHTTSSTLTNVMFDLVAYPHLIDELRKEIIEVLSPQAEDGGGWKKTSLYKLRLMDSVMKESQRVNPVDVIAMRRKVLEEVTLSDGTVLPAGAMVGIPTSALQDPALFDKPDEFDGHRFMDLRLQPGNENKWQFVTTSQEMFAFGHGKHACPGRFFAGNEVKIALVHLLMKYDWSFPGAEKGFAGRPKNICQAETILPDPTARLTYKARKPEIEI